MNDESRVRETALKITAHFGGSDYHACQTDDDAILRYGRYGFSLTSGALGHIIDRYLMQSTTTTAVALRPYQRRVAACDPDLRSETEFLDCLSAAADDSIMQKAQEEEAARCWDAVQHIALAPRQIRTPLAQALLFDLNVHFGAGDGFLRLVERESAGQGSLSETRLIMRTAELCKLSCERHATYSSRQRQRAEFWLHLVRRGDWQLESDAVTSIVASVQSAEVESIAEMPSQIVVQDASAPVIHITPIHERTRLRSRPVDGDTLAAITHGDVIDVLEPYAQASEKLGCKGQWLHVRTSEGVEGYTGAWLYTLVSDSTAPDEPVYIVAADDRIRIRTEAVHGETTAVISRGDVLQVLEPSAQAVGKIGVENEWLFVRAPDGTEGYTAAWFYAADPATAAQAQAEVTPAAQSPSESPSTPVPDLLLITPIEDRARIRTQPNRGETVGIAERGDVLQVLDSRVDALRKIGITGQWLHVRLPDGEEGYAPARSFILHHAPLTSPESEPEAHAVADDALLVTPTEDRIRVRTQPVIGEVIRLVSRGDVVEVLDPPDKAESMIGVEGQWLHVIAPDGSEGYSAAEFFLPFNGPLPHRSIQANMTGVNLDLDHPLGTPDPARLGQIGWVRLIYDLSLDPDKPEGDPYRYGNIDLDAAYARYQPVLKRYADAGIKVLLVLTEQTFGEGAGYPLDDMPSAQWRDLGFRFAQIAGRIAAQFRDEGIVQAYQIWDEMDAPSGARKVFPMSPEDYAYLLAQSIRAIRVADPEALVITGGHASELDDAVHYAHRVLNALPEGVYVDGLAMHPYGCGSPQSEMRFAARGPIDDQINAFAALMPGWPVWITAWGVLKAPDESPETIARYAAEFLGHLKQLYTHKVTAATWFAWAEGMGSGYSLVDVHDQPREGLTEEYASL